MSAKPLTLKREKAGAPKKSFVDFGETFLQVEVLVDSGVYHLDQTFSYLAPVALTPYLSKGTLVSCPFRGDKKVGLVLDVNESSKAGLKQINSVLIPHALSEGQIEFLNKVAHRYVASRADMLSLILPVGFTSQRKLPAALQNGVNRTHTTNSNKVTRESLLISSGLSCAEAAYARLKISGSGGRLVVASTHHDLEALRNLLIKDGTTSFVEMGAHLPLAQRRAAFNRILTEPELVVIGMRSAIFAPLVDLKEIIILDEYSRHHFEQRAPYWNTRDIALMRSETEQASLCFIGTSFSAEIWRLREIGWITSAQAEDAAARNAVWKKSNFFTEGASELSLIRQGLHKGNVLICVSDKDYAPGVVCSKCKTSIRCDCGARLLAKERGRYACSLCDFTTDNWRCSECLDNKVLIFRSGAKKVLEELGKTFPGQALFLSTADKRINISPTDKAIIVCTYGAEPIDSLGYSAIVLRDCTEMLNRSFVRAEEDTWQKIMKAINLRSKESHVYISLPTNHPISQALISGNSNRFFSSLLNEREEVGLPPLKRVFRISGETRSISSLRSKLQMEFSGVLEALISNSGSLITLKVEHQSANQILSALKALQKLRSTSGKSLFKIEVDPYHF